MSKVIYIEKKSVAPIDPVEGAVVDTLNVVDKVKNAPSINLVQQMTGIPQDGVIAFDGDVIPEGYEEVENNEILIETTLFTKVGNIVYIAMTEGALAAVTNIASYILPEKFRPKQNITIPCTYLTSGWVGMTGRLYINADGTMKVRKIQTGTYGTTEDATDGYIAINATYIAN